MPTTIPRSVVETDQKLEGAHDRASEALAKHRWHWTLDESNAGRVSFREYARAIGRKDPVVRSYAKGWALYRDRLTATPGVAAGFTVHDAIRLSEQSEEMQVFSEAIAEGSGVPIARVARGDNRHKTREIMHSAKERAERHGTDPVDEARTIAKQQVESRKIDHDRKAQRAERHEARWLAIEVLLSTAKVKLVSALREAEGVDFDERELKLLRGTINQVHHVLEVFDMRFSGDGDWAAELDKLSNEL